MTEVEDVKCIAETNQAILVVFEDENFWIPKSTLDHNSEVMSNGDFGTLILEEDMARVKGLI